LPINKFLQRLAVEKSLIELSTTTSSKRAKEPAFVGKIPDEFLSS
jgi:hypothetical protein